MKKLRGYAAVGLLALFVLIGVLVSRARADIVLPDKFTYAAGSASATVTVPAFTSVTSIMVHSTAGGTMTIAPGNALNAPITGPTITIPPSTGFNVPVPVLKGSLMELGPGSVITFGSGVDAYFVSLMTGGA